MKLDILYQDEYIIAVNKKSGLLVHPSAEASDRRTCLSVVRDQIGAYVYPLHRLDRGTSGVLLMGLDSDTTRHMQGAFARREVSKTYLAVTRGWAGDLGTLDNPLRKTADTKEDAVTHARTLATGTLPIPVGRYPEARYSLVEARPVTGRRHQIRRHLSYANYPIVGDAVHGDGKHNRLFRRIFQCYHILLHALRIEFRHPLTSELLTLSVPPPDDMREVCDRFGWWETLEREYTSIFNISPDGAS